jgi:hypothetical protein
VDEEENGVGQHVGHRHQKIGGQVPKREGGREGGQEGGRGE